MAQRNVCRIRGVDKNPKNEGRTQSGPGDNCLIAGMSNYMGVQLEGCPITGVSNTGMSNYRGVQLEGCPIREVSNYRGVQLEGMSN